MSWTIALIGSLLIGVLTWYLLRKPKRTPTLIQEIQDTLGHLHIYVGTQSGHSMTLAEILASEARKYHFSPHIISLENFQILEFKKNDFCVILCSTGSDGSPPENAKQFLKWVTKVALASNENLSSLSYAVLGLTKSLHNNTTASKINAGLARLGAVEIMKVGEAEENDMSAFRSWMQQLWKVMPGMVKASRRSAVKDSEYLEVAHQVPLGEPCKNVKYEKPTAVYMGSKDLKILKMKELKRDPECSALHVEFECPSSYETGGKIGIFPENDEEIVREIAALQGYDLELSFQFLSTNKSHPFPSPITVREALIKYCDLTTLVRKKTLKKLAAFASNPEEQQKLEKLSSLKGKDEFKRQLVEPMVSVADIFKMFPSLKIPISILVQVLDRIEARYYNISSSKTCSPSKMHIVVEVLRERTCEGKVRTGLCSGYLEKMHVTGLYKNVRGFLLPSKFKFPSSPSVIHLICNRCGIAAFKGFLLEMQQNALNSGETHQINIYLGCKSKSTQFIYKQDLEKLIWPSNSPVMEFEYVPEKIHEGPYIIKRFYATFSRDNAQKKHVKDILFMQQENIWDSICNENACIMVCGSTSLGRKVKECITNIASEHLAEGAAEFIQKLISQSRYIEEVWD